MFAFQDSSWTNHFHLAHANRGTGDLEDVSPCASPSLPSPPGSSCTMGKGVTVPTGLGEAQPRQQMSPLQNHETSQRDVLNWPLRRGGEAISSPGPLSRVDQPWMSLEQALRAAGDREAWPSHGTMSITGDQQLAPSLIYYFFPSWWSPNRNR